LINDIIENGLKAMLHYYTSVMQPVPTP